MTDQSAIDVGAPDELKMMVIPHLSYALCAVVTIAFIVWSTFGSLDIVSMATGEVIPSTQLKTVQHLEGGIVSKILVREGERVKKNQKMVVWHRRHPVLT